MDPTTGYVAMSRFRSASDVLIMQPFDLGFYQQGPTLEPELFIQYNRMRLVERLDSDSLHALFDNYTTKSERKKRKKAEQTAGEKVAQNEHRRINYEPGKRKKAYDPDKRKKAYDESKTPKTTPANSPQKRPAPSQAGMWCSKCTNKIDVKDGIDVSSKLRKLRKDKRVCSAIGKMCRPHK